MVMESLMTLVMTFNIQVSLGLCWGGVGQMINQIHMILGVILLGAHNLTRAIIKTIAH